MLTTDLEHIRIQHAKSNVANTMMDMPLRVTDLIKRAEQIFPNREVISRTGYGSIERTTYGDLAINARKLAAGLKKMGVKPGMRVATLMWSHSTHLAFYYATPAIDAVLHPLNLRLSAEEIAYIIADAGDDVVIIDEDLIPLWESISKYVSPTHVILNGSRNKGYPVLEDLLKVQPISSWPDGPLDENQAVGICYTSGTTGKPKGVVYSHRSTILHALSSSLQSGFGFSSNDTLMTLTPLFHVNGWGVPYSATMLGAKQILPGAHISVEEILDISVDENVTAILGVPTIWSEMLKALDSEPDRWKFSQPPRIHSGGAQPPLDMFRRFQRLGMTMQNGWGMTECSPIAAQTWLQVEHELYSDEERLALLASNGLPIPLVESRISNDQEEALPWDGKSTGELQVRAPWITAHYLSWEQEITASTSDGWLKSGDLATIRPDGYIRIVDRLKDLVKSGGEWISSVDMENALCDHPAILEAAVIAVPDEKWGERPLALVRINPDFDEITSIQIRDYLSKHYPKWMIPDTIELVNDLPKTSTGKLNKAELRRRLNSCIINDIDSHIDSELKKETDINLINNSPFYDAFNFK